MHSLILFASGRGSNVQAILNFFRGNGQVAVRLIVCNNPKAGVIQVAAAENVPLLLVDRATFTSPGFIEKLRQQTPALIVLAGFLWKVPPAVIAAFPHRIINIHPALLPRYGGKGMYGNYVHEAVLAAGDRETGITIHLIDEDYDRGSVVLQARCPVGENDNAEEIAAKVHQLEHYYLPRTIAFLLSQRYPQTINCQRR